jgi:uncharacterized OsmC-like protein
MSDRRVAAVLEATSAEFARHPERARIKGVTAVATLSSGMVCEVRGPNGEYLKTDMPPPLGGAASAPSPGWLLRASMASCAATVIASRAAMQGIALSLLEVSATSESDLRGQLDGEPPVPARLYDLALKVRIASPTATPAELQAIVEWGQAHSPVGCTVCAPSECSLQVEVVRPAAR